MSIKEHPLPSGLFLDMDRNGPVPLYFQIATRLEKAILNGDLPPGSRLENELALGERLGLSRPTIRRAIQDLVEKGLLVRRRGIGTQVVHGRVTRNVELTSLFDDLSRSGQHPTSQILSFRKQSADAQVAEALGTVLHYDVMHIRRVRFADGVPFAILENYLPVEVVSFNEAELAEHGLYQLIRASGTSLRVAKQKIGARRATTEECKHLGIDKGSPVLTAERVTYDSSGRAVEYGHHCYRPDLYSFETTLVEK